MMPLFDVFFKDIYYLLFILAKIYNNNIILRNFGLCEDFKQVLKILAAPLTYTSLDRLLDFS